MNEKAILAACAHAFELGAIRAWAPHGGTAGKNWRLTTDSGVWLVRLRGTRTSSDACLHFDHSFRAFLLDQGIPTAAPRRARNGATFLRIHGRTFEVYPFLPGIALESAGPAPLAAAARALARFHRAGRIFPDARREFPISQYGSLGIHQTSHRLEDPALLEQVYRNLTARPDAARFSRAGRTAREWIARLRREFPDPVHDRLPHTVVHGDYTLANLLFTPEDQVAGIFDLDWARWAPAVRDVADGMLFIAGTRHSPLRSGDIWSLTEPPDLEVRRCALWLSAYCSVRPLTPAEWAAVPLALAARWLSVRAEGTAKVPDSAASEFCFRPLLGPLEQIEARWDRIRTRAKETLSALERPSSTATRRGTAS